MARLSLAPCAFLMVMVALNSNVASAQPDLTPQPHTFTHRSTIDLSVVVPSKGPVTLTLNAFHAKFSDVVQQIATRGDLQVLAVASANPLIDALSFAGLSPERALQRVCHDEKLDCRNQDGVWIVSDATPPVANDKELPAGVDSVEFEDINITDVLSLIAKEFKIPLTIDPNVRGKIPYLLIQAQTPLQTIKLIASAAGLSVQEDGEALKIAPIAAPKI